MTLAKLGTLWNMCESIEVLVVQSCPTLCNPMESSHQASPSMEFSRPRILVWVAIPFSRGSSQPRDQTWISCIEGRFSTIWATREALGICVHKNKTKWETDFFTSGLYLVNTCTGHGGLACCDSWGREESDTTERLNWTELKENLLYSTRSSTQCSVVT